MVEVELTLREQTSIERRYFISSKKRLTAKTALSTVRVHWGIENRLHCVLDLAFREDECRVRAGNAAENFAVLRHFTLNMLKNVKSKVGIKIRRQQAGWGDQFLLEVLFANWMRLPRGHPPRSVFIRGKFGDGGRGHLLPRANWVFLRSR